MFRLLLFLIFLAANPVFAAEAPVHGLWVWNTATILDTPEKVEALRDFSKSAGVTEVYLSVPRKDFAAQENRLPGMIGTLQKAGLRVEALMDGIDEDKAGPPRNSLLGHVDAIVAFNQRHPEARFDGIHLDIEPHQRVENKGAGNLRFLDGLIETFRGVTERASADGMTTNADIANKFLKGDLAQRRALLTSVPRVTLMLYELNSPTDGKSVVLKEARLMQMTKLHFQTAYTGLPEEGGAPLAKMTVALRTPDYLELLPKMLGILDQSQESNPHYLGWALHSYNDPPPTPGAVKGR